MAVKYLDNAGTQYLVNKIKAIDGKIPTESQITTMITTALNTYKEGIVTIVESLPQTGEEGKLYLMVDPSDSDVYIIYTWEENAFKRMGSKTFTLTVDSALSSTSTNPVQNKVIKTALDGKANSSHTHGSITNDGKLGTASRVVITGTDKKIGISTVTTTELGYLSGVTSAIQTQLNSKSATGHTHTAGDVAGLATVATTGSYNDLTDKPSINNATLTIQKNGSTVKTFTANASSNVTCNITVPTKTSELTNDSNFLTTSSSLNASKLTGTIDIARLPQGALERVITVADQTARFALTTSSVQLGDTVKQLDTGVMYVVVNESKLNSNDGYLEYTAGSASSVPWSGITSKPTEFTPSSHTHTKSEITDFPTNVSAFTNDSGYLTAHQSLSNYVTLNTAQEITNAKTFKDTSTARKLTSVEAGNVIPSSDKLISDIWQDKNGKELGRIYYSKTKGGNTALIMRAGDWFTSNEGVYTLDASGTNRRAELHLYSDSSGNCCIKPVGYFSATLKPLSSSVWLGESTNPFGRVYANAFEFCNAGLLPNTDVQTAEEHSIGFYGQNNTPLSYITFQKRPNLKDRIAVRVQTAVSAYKSYCFDATCFYPEASNNLDIGSTTNIFKNIYCNNYYKGTTAFGDIVTHNASEFLTSHQSLDSCLKNSVTNNQTIKSTAITRGTAPSSAQTFGIAFSDNNNKYIGNVYGTFATDKSTYVGLYAYKGTTTSNGDNAYLRVGYDASGNVYTSAPTPATADNSTQIATTAFVKAQGYLTSHQSLANYVTTNTDQSISGIKSHSKHISILGDYVGNESSTNGRSCLYLKANRDTDGKSGLYVTKFRQNVAQGSMGSSDVVFLSHDILENETRTNAGFVESYSNWTNNVPGGVSIYSTIATRNLGTSAKPWTNAYITNLNLNGNAFDPTSIDGIGTTRLLAYEPVSTGDHSNPAGTTKSGSALYDVRMDLSNANGSGIFDSSSSGTFGVTVDTNRTQSGTWKVLHYISVGVPYSGHRSFVIAMWVRIA